MSKISIVVPVYKAEQYLHQCVDSILAQTFTDLELILVDDGSPDNCPAICGEYAARDSRVHVIHKQNGGVASAVAAGIQAAVGGYIGFVDSDDWIDPTYYEQLYRRITEQDADMAEGQFVNELFSQGVQKTLGADRSASVTYAGQEDIRRLTGLYMTSFLYDGMPDRPDRPLTYGKWDKLYRAELLRRALPLYGENLSLGEDAVLNAAVLPECRKVVTAKTSARYHHRILAGTVSHKASLDEMPRIRAVREALRRVVDEKGLDSGGADAFVGSMVHARIYRTAELPDVRLREKCRRMKAMYRQAPDGTLRAFVLVRGSLFLRLFYGMLRLGLAAPCVWMVTMHAALSGHKS